MTKAEGCGQKDLVPILVRFNEQDIPAMIRRPRSRVALAVVHEPPEHAGKIAISRWHDEYHQHATTPANRTRRWHLDESVFHAYRQTLEILFTYGVTNSEGERSLLQMAHQEVAKLHAMFFDRFESPYLDRRSVEIEEQVRLLAKLFSYGRTAGKRQIKAMLPLIAKLLDKLQRQNRSAQLARIVAIRTRIEKRLEMDIPNITPAIAERQQLLLEMILDAEMRIFSTLDLVERLLRYHGLRDAFRPWSRQPLVQQLKLYADRISALDFRPFYHNAYLTAQDLREAADLISRGRPDRESIIPIRASLSRCKTALRIKLLHIEIERVIYAITLSQKRLTPFPVEKVRNTTTRVYKALAALDSQLLRDHTYKQSMQMLEAVLSRLETLLHDPSADPRVRIEEIRNALIKAGTCL